MTISVTNRRAYAPDKKSSVLLYDLIATGMVPESLIRLGIRGMLVQKLAELRCDDSQMLIKRTARFAEELKQQPIAIAVDFANQQHYEVPTEFFQYILGPAMKYSCCLWTEAVDLKRAELAMLELTCKRAEIADGQNILDLGCGWGSFSLFVAARYKNIKITAVSNSQSQKSFIEAKACELGITNLTVITADINEFEINQRFDRVVSVEMFEHAKNYERLLAKIAGWLCENGKLFVHIFSHIQHQYHFDVSDQSDWLSRYFFTGGTMPSDKLLLHFQNDLTVTGHWRVNGEHYKKTADAWLDNMVRNRKPLLKIIGETYGQDQSRRWWIYWRLFFMSCAELFGFDGGTQWMVSHYLFAKR